MLGLAQGNFCNQVEAQGAGCRQGAWEVCSKVGAQAWFSTGAVSSTLAKGTMHGAHVRFPESISLSIVSGHRAQMSTEQVLLSGV